MSGERPAARDSALMRRALANALNGWGQTAPNPMVGAVVVSGDQVVADGWHARFGEAHAEVMALSAAKEAARGSTVYVTLEPCNHQGKTPPCTEALIAAGVARVVIAARDPNPVAAGGVRRLRDAGIDVVTGVEQALALEANAAFFHSFVSDRPWVTLKLARSADGGIADPAGTRRWITGAEARREVHRMRAAVDAVAVGVGTVIADDPDLTVRDWSEPRVQPTRVVFDRQFRTPVGSRVVRNTREVPTIMVVPEESPRADVYRAAGVEIVIAAGLPASLVALRAKGIRSMMLEGGAELAGAFLREKLVDRIAIFEAPVRLGPAALGAFSSAPPGTEEWLQTLPVVDRHRFGEDTLITYAVREVPCSPA